MNCLNSSPPATYPNEWAVALLKHIHLFTANVLRVVAYRDTTGSILQGTPVYYIIVNILLDFHLIVFLFKMSAAPAADLISISYLPGVVHIHEQ